MFVLKLVDIYLWEVLCFFLRALVSLFKPGLGIM